MSIARGVRHEAHGIRTPGKCWLFMYCIPVVNLAANSPTVWGGRWKHSSQAQRRELKTTEKGAVCPFLPTGLIPSSPCPNSPALYLRGLLSHLINAFSISPRCSAAIVKLGICMPSSRKSPPISITFRADYTAIKFPSSSCSTTSTFRAKAAQFSCKYRKRRMESTMKSWSNSCSPPITTFVRQGSSRRHLELLLCNSMAARMKLKMPRA